MSLRADVLPNLRAGPTPRKCGTPRRRVPLWSMGYTPGLRRGWDARMRRGGPSKAASIKNDLQTRYSRASIYYIEGSWEQALQTLVEAYARAQGGEKDSMVGVESRFLLGQCYQQLGRWREAREAYEEFITANPFEKEAFANLGLVKAKLGDSEGAVTNFSKAVDLDPKFLDARRNRGTEYLRQKRYDLAIQDFSAVLAEYAGDVGILYKRAYA